MEKYRMNQRRIRNNRHVRELVAGHWINHRQFIQPIFVSESLKDRKPNSSLAEQYVETEESVLIQIESDLAAGISKFLLFPIPRKHQNDWADFTFVQRVTSNIKSHFGNSVWLAVDVCLCAYTPHGHCGVLSEITGQIDNHKSVEILSQYALELATSGADCIAPSDMMDNRILAIRSNLDQNGFDHVSIMSYSAKFSSSFYGPFRDVCHSAPSASNQLKDRRSYQISNLNTEDALLSTLRDIDQGADIIMIKPALPYLDIVASLKSRCHQPMAIFHVSGEYQSIECLVNHQLINRPEAHLEVWNAMIRSGANMIISYASRYASTWIAEMEV